MAKNVDEDNEDDFKENDNVNEKNLLLRKKKSSFHWVSVSLLTLNIYMFDCCYIYEC